MSALHVPFLLRLQKWIHLLSCCLPYGSFLGTDLIRVEPNVKVFFFFFFSKFSNQGVLASAPTHACPFPPLWARCCSHTHIIIPFTVGSQFSQLSKSSSSVHETQVPLGMSLNFPGLTFFPLISSSLRVKRIISFLWVIRIKGNNVFEAIWQVLDEYYFVLSSSAKPGWTQF